MLVPGGLYSVEFTLLDGTGVPADADSTPVATANVAGVDDPTFVLGVASVATGRYQVTGTIPPTYAVGSVVKVTISATISGIAASKQIDAFTVVSPDSLIVPGSPDAVPSAYVDAILAALSSPASVSGDAGSVTQRSIPDLIMAANYGAGLAAINSPSRGVRFSKLVPDGTVEGRRARRHFNRRGCD